MLQSGFSEGPIVLLPEALKSIPHLPPPPLSLSATRHHRGKRPIDYTGLAFMIHATEEERDREGKWERRGERESGREGGGGGTLRGPAV